MLHSKCIYMHYPNRQVIYMVRATMCNCPRPSHVVQVHYSPGWPVCRYATALADPGAICPWLTHAAWVTLRLKSGGLCGLGHCRVGWPVWYGKCHWMGCDMTPPINMTSLGQLQRRKSQWEEMWVLWFHRIIVCTTVPVGAKLNWCSEKYLPIYENELVPQGIIHNWFLNLASLCNL